MPLQLAQDRFPLWLMRHIEPFTRKFFEVTHLISRVLWKDVGAYEGPAADQALQQTYLEQ